MVLFACLPTGPGSEIRRLRRHRRVLRSGHSVAALLRPSARGQASARVGGPRAGACAGARAGRRRARATRSGDPRARRSAAGRHCPQPVQAVATNGVAKLKPEEVAALAFARAAGVHEPHEPEAPSGAGLRPGHRGAAHACGHRGRAGAQRRRQRRTAAGHTRARRAEPRWTRSRRAARRHPGAVGGPRRPSARATRAPGGRDRSRRRRGPGRRGRARLRGLRRRRQPAGRYPRHAHAGGHAGRRRRQTTTPKPTVTPVKKSDAQVFIFTTTGQACSAATYRDALVGDAYPKANTGVGTLSEDKQRRPRSRCSDAPRSSAPLGGVAVVARHQAGRGDRRRDEDRARRRESGRGQGLERGRGHWAGQRT